MWPKSQNQCHAAIHPQVAQRADPGEKSASRVTEKKRRGKERSPLASIPYHMVCSEQEKHIEQREEPVMAQLSRRRWLEEGLALLEEAGAEALTIESLTSRLGVTKGSFYHHFTNYQDFKQRLLSFWEEEHTLQVIQAAELAPSAQEKLEHVVQATLRPSH